MISYAYWFDVPLTCLACGTTTAGSSARLSVSGLNSEPRGDRWVHAGDVLPIYEGDFSDAFVTLRPPEEASPVVALAQWGCPACHDIQWVKLDFEKIDGSHHRFVTAGTVPLSPDLFNQTHYVSHSLADWLASNPGEETGALLKIVDPALG